MSITLPGRRHRPAPEPNPQTGVAGLCQVAAYMDGVLVGIGSPCDPDTALRVRDTAQETCPDQRRYRVVPAVIATVPEPRYDLERLYRVAQIRDEQLIALGDRVGLDCATMVASYCAEHPTEEHPEDEYLVVAA